MLLRRFPSVRIVQGELDAHADATGDELAQALRCADLVIHNSSMGQSLTLMQACQKLGKPCGMFGQSYFADFVQQPATRESLNGRRFCTAGRR